MRNTEVRKRILKVAIRNGLTGGSTKQGSIEILKRAGLFDQIGGAVRNGMKALSNGSLARGGGAWNAITNPVGSMLSNRHLNAGARQQGVNVNAMSMAGRGMSALANPAGVLMDFTSLGSPVAKPAAPAAKLPQSPKLPPTVKLPQAPKAPEAPKPPQAFTTPKAITSLSPAGGQPKFNSNLPPGVNWSVDREAMRGMTKQSGIGTAIRTGVDWLRRNPVKSVVGTGVVGAGSAGAGWLGGLFGGGSIDTKQLAPIAQGSGTYKKHMDPSRGLIPEPKRAKDWVPPPEPDILGADGKVKYLGTPIESRDPNSILEPAPRNTLTLAPPRDSATIPATSVVSEPNGVDYMRGEDPAYGPVPGRSSVTASESSVDPAIVAMYQRGEDPAYGPVQSKPATPSPSPATPWHHGLSNEVIQAEADRRYEEEMAKLRSQMAEAKARMAAMNKSRSGSPFTQESPFSVGNARSQGY